MRLKHLGRAQLLVTAPTGDEVHVVKLEAQSPSLRRTRSLNGCSAHAKQLESPSRIVM